MDMRDSPPPVGEEELREFERQHGLALPEDYKQFLLRHNGGTPEPNSFNFAGSEGGSLVQCLYGIGPAVPSYAQLEPTIEIFAGRMPAGVIAVGSDPFGNQMCLATSGARAGAVYFWDHEKEAGPSYANMSLIADSFDEFLDGLFALEPEFHPASELHLVTTRLIGAAEAARTVIRLLPESEMARDARRMLEEPSGGQGGCHVPENFCCMVRVVVSEPGARVSARKIAAAERRIGVVFPAAYRRFLLEFNGGSPEPTWFRAKDGTDEPLSIRYLYSIGGGEFAGVVERAAAERALPGAMIPIGLGGMADLACLQISGTRAGAVYHISNIAEFATGDRGAPRLLADDFDELLHRGYDNERDPCWQLEGATACLDDGRRVAAELIQRARGTAEAGAVCRLLEVLDAQGLAAAARAAEAMPGGKGPP